MPPVVPIAFRALRVPGRRAAWARLPCADNPSRTHACQTDLTGKDPPIEFSTSFRAAIYIDGGPFGSQCHVLSRWLQPFSPPVAVMQWRTEHGW
jgi:hypothetical protein